MIPVLLDVDTGLDDALALALAIGLEELSLVAVTTVAGNVDVERTTRNTRRVLDWLGAVSVPVARGSARPLLRPHRAAPEVHGEDGLGGARFPSGRTGPVIDTSAPEVIVRTARRYPGRLRVVCLAPLTNLAMALRLEPALPELVERLVVMGGAFEVPGNVTPAAEFNVWSDPEAAWIVAEAGFRAVWVGLDVTRHVRLERRARPVDADPGSPAGWLLETVARWFFDVRREESFALHDPLAVAVAACPELVAGVAARVTVDLEPDSSAGRTRATVETGGSTLVARAVDTEGFFASFRKVFASGSDRPPVVHNY
ncbi:MAG: nucleoside hydrolase [Thermomicrobium sp.]|nr:nucleoside hydrolase [Thermomicrobium sp.]MDW8058705.1 nucleoside hydrolase [Thermomicrobium sp.]